MDKEIIELYKNAGYKPEQMITSLIGLVGASLLSYKQDTADYSNDAFDVSVKVYDKTNKS